MGLLLNLNVAVLYVWWNRNKDVITMRRSVIGK